MPEKAPLPSSPLHSKYPELHKSQPVEYEATRLRAAGERIPNEPTPKLEAWLRLIERTHTGKGGSEKRQAAQHQVYERIKDIYHRPTQDGGYITGIDDASIERYLHHQARIAHEQGHGAVEDLMARANDQVRAEAQDTIRTGQERSLDAWLDYLSSDDAGYPTWFKYYTFRNITRLADYDKQKGEFPKRSKSTTAPFPDINREALAYMEDSLAKHYGLKDINPNNPAEVIAPETQVLLDKDANFASLYKRAIEYAAPKHAENLNVTDGQWIKYEQTTDQARSNELAHSLHGYGTGWCTAGEGMAHSQLSGGDFYVYYTRAEDGQYSVPRVAIRMQNTGGKQHIAEVRGVEADQNMEAYLVPIADAKLAEIDPESAESYKKKSEDMRCLTEIDNLLKDNPKAELSKEQLHFLYEIDSKIEGFGYQKDPRTSKILQQRDMKADLSFVLEIPAVQISTTKEEALSGNIQYHYGNLYIADLNSAEELQLPRNIGGDLNISGLTSAHNLHLPESIGGSLNLSGLKTPKDLKLPNIIGGNIYLGGLSSANGVHFPESIGGNLDLRRITTTNGLDLPKSIDGSIDLSRLTSAIGLDLPDTIKGELNLSGLISAEGLHLPESIGGNLNLRSLTTANSLVLPEIISGVLDLSGLISAEGLRFPESVGSLYLSRLSNTAGLKLPIEIRGSLDLGSLYRADGSDLPDSIYFNNSPISDPLKLPDIIDGDLILLNLKSAKGIQFPQRIGRNLDLRCLTSAEGLQLPERVGEQIMLYNLSREDEVQLEKEYPQFADQWSWYSAGEEEEEEEEEEEID